MTSGPHSPPTKLTLHRLPCRIESSNSHKYLFSTTRYWNSIGRTPRPGMECGTQFECGPVSVCLGTINMRMSMRIECIGRPLRTLPGPENVVCLLHPRSSSNYGDVPAAINTHYTHSPAIINGRQLFFKMVNCSNGVH